MTSVRPGAVVQHVTLPNKVTAGGEEQSMSYQEIMPLLHGLQPVEFAAAAQAHYELADALETARTKIAATGDAMAANGSWTGTAAQAAMNQFQQVHDEAAQLSAQARQTGNALHWFATEATPPFQQVKSPQVMSKTESDSIMGTAAGTVLPLPGVGTAAGAALGKMGLGPNGQGKADAAARGYLAAYNQQLEKMNKALPNPISGSPDKGNSGQWNASNQSPGSASGTAPGSGAGYGGASGSGTSGNVPGYRSSSTSANPFASPAGVNSAGHANASAKLPGSSSPASNASLQGYAAPSSTETSPFAGGSPAMGTGGSANPFANVMLVSGGSSGFGSGSGGAAGEDTAGEDALKASKNALNSDDETPGDSSASGGADGAAGESAGAGEAEAAGAGEGESGMPMGGMGGGGSQNSERRRQAWMSEDKSIWGLPERETGSEIS